MPSFDPGTDFVQWDGKRWNVNDNRVFEARFEKFLNAPETLPESDLKYNALLTRIMDLLAPNKSTPKTTDEAFLLLAQASEFDVDLSLIHI